MSLQIGIVGLPNVGKSTIFNALTKSRKANVANYPFCTIDPNVGVVEVQDPRLYKIAEIAKPAKIIPAAVEFVDIAGLVRGASKGEGLGNQFLANIRECNAVAEVVRVFEDPDVSHVHETIDPKRDIEIIRTELILADLQTLEKRLEKAKNDIKAGEKKTKEYLELLQRLQKILNEGRPAVSGNFSENEKTAFRDLHLLTMKKVLYIANVHENEIAKCTKEFLHEKLGLPETEEVIPISAKIEEEIGSLKDEDAQEFLKDLGLRESGLSALIHAAYRTLGLETFFTAGPKEVHAWTFVKGTKAPQAAGIIHTDFEKGFIAAEVISYEDYVKSGGEHACKERGKMRVSGNEYIVRDGDVIFFRFNV